MKSETPLAEFGNACADLRKAVLEAFAPLCRPILDWLGKKLATK